MAAQAAAGGRAPRARAAGGDPGPPTSYGSSCSRICATGRWNRSPSCAHAAVASSSSAASEAEVTVDEVAVMNGQSVSQAFVEVEIELRSGDPSRLDKIAREIARAGASRRTGTPKVFPGARHRAGHGRSRRARPAFVERPARHVVVDGRGETRGSRGLPPRAGGLEPVRRLQLALVLDGRVHRRHLRPRCLVPPARHRIVTGSTPRTEGPFLPCNRLLQGLDGSARPRGGAWRRPRQSG